MRAMILAAGRGERMGHLTAHKPKSLLNVAGHYLIEYSLYRLLHAGISDIVINVSYLGEQIQETIGDGKKYGVRIVYSFEEERLETGGGIFKALPLLGNEPFLVISSDIITDFPIQQLKHQSTDAAHLVMVKNPVYHSQGDFGLKGNKIDIQATPSLTFANIGLYHPDFFSHCKPGYFRLAALLKPAIHAGKVTGEFYQGLWYNVGTPQDLADVNQRAREDSNLRPLVSETNTLSN